MSTEPTDKPASDVPSSEASATGTSAPAEPGAPDDSSDLRPPGVLRRIGRGLFGQLRWQPPPWLEAIGRGLSRGAGWLSANKPATAVLLFAVMLIGGLTGALAGFFMQFWNNAYGYSLNIGGRPASSLPHGMKALKEQWRAEWEAERAEEEQREAEEEAEAEEEFMRRMAKLRAACLRETAEGPAKPFGWEGDEGEG